MFAHERHQRLTELLHARGTLAVASLPRLLRASPATVRRDLEHLERIGRVVRTHGGVSHPDALPGEADFSRRARAAMPAKLAIAGAAAALVPDGATVFVDAGTTALEAGRRLLERAGLTLVTHSVPLLAGPHDGRSRLIAIGGELRGVSRAFVGGLALSWLRSLRFDYAILAASGLDPAEGASTTELLEAAVKQEVVARARHTVLVADASKWARPAAVRFAGWEDIGDFVTDHRLTRAEAALLARAGTAVHQVRR